MSFTIPFDPAASIQLLPNREPAHRFADGHLLLTGPDGSGKTHALRNIVRGASILSMTVMLATIEPERFDVPRPQYLLGSRCALSDILRGMEEYRATFDEPVLIAVDDADEFCDTSAYDDRENMSGLLLEASRLPNVWLALTQGTEVVGYPMSAIAPELDRSQEHRLHRILPA